MRTAITSLLAAAAMALTATPTLAAHTPQGPGDEVSCGDFATWGEAQDHYAAHSEDGDPSGLDGDGDGIACEHLPGPFTDVAPVHPFAEEILWFKGAGITTGWPDGTFRGAEPITREAFAAFLYRYAHGTDAPACETQRFGDVSLANPFCGHIAWLADTGITTGYPDGGFHPSSHITRQAVAAFLLRFRNLSEPTDAECDPTRFQDLPGTPFCDAVTWLAGTGITTGYDDGTFRPGTSISRDAVAAFFHRYAAAFDADPSPPVRCGDTLTEDVTLTADLVCDDPDVPALTLTSGVTLDLDGNEVRFDGPDGEGTGIRAWGPEGGRRLDDVTVRDGRVSGFALAFDLGETDEVVLSDLVIEGSIWAHWSDYRLRDSRVVGDISQDIGRPIIERNVVEGTISMSRVTATIVDNQLSAGDRDAIGFGEVQDVVVRDNVVTSSRYGVHLGGDVYGAEVSGNRFAGTQVGVQIGGPSQRIAISDNDFSAVGRAIHLHGPLNGWVQILRNHVVGARLDAIRIEQDQQWPEEVTVSQNVVDGAGGYAVYAPGAGTSGVGNVVSDIALDPPCVGEALQCSVG